MTFLMIFDTLVVFFCRSSYMINKNALFGIIFVNILTGGG